jgi:hypothetical protein
MERQPDQNRRMAMKKTIGKVTTYNGTEHRYMTGYKVRIVSILKNDVKPGIDVDGPEYQNISDDIDLERAGGVTTFDRFEVQPYIEKEGRFSWVTSDPKAVDLACFKYLAKTQ